MSFFQLKMKKPRSRPRVQLINQSIRHSKKGKLFSAFILYLWAWLIPDIHVCELVNVSTMRRRRRWFFSQFNFKYYRIILLRSTNNKTNLVILCVTCLRLCLYLKTTSRFFLLRSSLIYIYNVRGTCTCNRYNRHLI